MDVKRLALIILGIASLGLVRPSAAQAQEIVDEALQDFPSGTQRLEYSDSAKLRQLPSYDILRQRYLGARLQQLEKSLAKLGIKESDINELVLGWQGGSGQNANEWDLYGIAAGRFNSDEIASQAAAQGLKPRPVGVAKAYCLTADTAGTCLAVLDDTRGAFGTLKQISAIATARSGNAAGLNSAGGFANLVNESKSDAPIWGVAEGAAVTDWLRASMPSQSNMDLDWTQAFSGVKTMSYSINVTEKVHLEMKLNCQDAATASGLRQVLDGLRSFQQMAWQNKNPSVPNPFENVAVNASGAQVDLSLDTVYPAA